MTAFTYSHLAFCIGFKKYFCKCLPGVVIPLLYTDVYFFIRRGNQDFHLQNSYKSVEVYARSPVKRLYFTNNNLLDICNEAVLMVGMVGDNLGASVRKFHTVLTL